MPIWVHGLRRFWGPTATRAPPLRPPLRPPTTLRPPPSHVPPWTCHVWPPAHADDGGVSPSRLLPPAWRLPGIPPPRPPRDGSLDASPLPRHVLARTLSAPPVHAPWVRPPASNVSQDGGGCTAAAGWRGDICRRGSQRHRGPFFPQGQLNEPGQPADHCREDEGRGAAPRGGERPARRRGRAARDGGAGGGGEVEGGGGRRPRAGLHAHVGGLLAVGGARRGAHCAPRPCL
mmetsp:Transcript_5611/g.8299  ORF Transcript_5611/g.8299 Transcript_5611/m.8299 type:complete len:232 (-) Transcript_5611:44-739(-)